MVQVTRPELLKKAQGLSNMFKFNKNAKIASIDIVLICHSDVFAVNFEPIQFIKCSVFMVRLNTHLPGGNRILHGFL